MNKETIKKASEVKIELKSEFQGKINLYSNKARKYLDLGEVINNPRYNMVKNGLINIFKLSKENETLISNLSVHEAIEADKLMKSKATAGKK